MKIKDIDITAETERLSALAAVMLEKARRDAGLKYKDIAARLDIPPSRVTKVLDGEANMTLRTIAQFTLACNTRWTFENLVLEECEETEGPVVLKPEKDTQEAEASLVFCGHARPWARAGPGGGRLQGQLRALDHHEGIEQWRTQLAL